VQGGRGRQKVASIRSSFVILSASQVWAATHRVGCDVEQCQMDQLDGKGRKTGKKRTYYLYVCNYCPM